MSRIIQIGSLALIALLGGLLVKIALLLIAPSHAEAPLTVAAPATTPASTAVPQNYDFSTDPFQASTALPAPVAVGEDAPETTLKLTLTGLITGPRGSAYLRTPEGKEARYGIGQEILNGVTLQAVNADFIVLDVEGQVQRLTFEREDPFKLSSANRAISTAPSDTANLSQKDLQSFLRDVRIYPARENAKVIGMRVRARAGTGGLKEYGLQDGDIITRIGAIDLTDTRPNIAELSRMAQGARQVEITIMRRGQTQTLMIGR